MKYEKLRANRKEIEPETSMPPEGPEKGIPHHGFTEQELFGLLRSHSFEVEEVLEKDEHYSLLAVKRC